MNKDSHLQARTRLSLTLHSYATISSTEKVLSNSKSESPGPVEGQRYPKHGLLTMSGEETTEYP